MYWSDVFSPRLKHLSIAQLLLFFKNCSEKKMHVGNSSILFYFTANRDKIKALVQQTVASCSKDQEQV